MSEEDQLALTRAAEQRKLDERIKARTATAEDITREIAHLEGRLRYLRRQLKRLQR